MKYKRILLKVSGEVLAGEKGTGYDDELAGKICLQIKKCTESGAEIAIVVGGGNYWRGRVHEDMNKSKADSIGMLATAMNAIALSDTFARIGCQAQVFSAVDMPKFAKLFTAEDAVEALKKGKILIFACGTGNPCFSTDSGAALRAVEIGADVFFKSTNVDGVYNKDPHKNPDAKKYDIITQSEILSNRLAVMDATAAAICRENHLPTVVFNLDPPENIYRAVMGEEIGTVVLSE